MGKKFTFGATPVAKIADEIRNDEPANIQQPVDDIHPEVNEQSAEINTQHSTLNAQHSTLNTQQSTLNTQQSTVNTQQSTLNNKKPKRSAKKSAGAVDDPADDKPATGKKMDVGVTIQLPKKYYRQLRDIKDETGIALRDLALKAVMEFVDNYEFED